jgi:predicted RNase H-like HicB family nuclease
MQKYEIRLWWSEDDRCFVAEAPELEGCIAHGATQEEALANAQNAIRLWIDVAVASGDPVPKPRVPSDAH